MKNEMLEIKNAIYTGMCIYNRLRKSIVEVEGKFVQLEDKRDLSLYLGIIHSENSISSLLNETQLKKNTMLDYKKLEEKTIFNICEEYFSNNLLNVEFETIEEYFNSLLNKEIIISLNRENNFDATEFINASNKQLIKK